MNVTRPGPVEAPPRASAVPAPSTQSRVGAPARAAVRRAPIVLLGVALFAGFWLRSYELGAQSIWGDEIYSHMYTQMDWLQILRFNIAMQDPQAPLYYYLLKAFVGVAGLWEFSLRYPSLLAGVASIAAIFAVGRALAGASVGAIAALILAFNPYHVWFSQETRTYTLTTFLALLSLLFFLRVLRGQTTRWTWIGYVGFSSLLVYSHYFGFLLLVFYNVAWLALRCRRQLPWKGWLIAQSAFVLPYLPFAPHGLRMMSSFSSTNQSDLSWSFLDRSLSSYSLGWFLEPGLSSALLLGFIAIVVIGVSAPVWTVRPRRAGNVEPAASNGAPAGFLAAVWGRLADDRRDAGRFRGREQVLLLLGYGVIPVVIVVLALQVTNRVLLQDRYLILITPAYYLLLALGVNALRRLWTPLGALALLFVLTTGAASIYAYYTDPRFARYDVRGLAQHVFREGQPGDIVVTIAPIHDYFSYYYKGPLDVTRVGQGQPEQVPAELAPIARQYRRIWLIPYEDGLLDQAAENWLDRSGFRLDARWFKTARVRLYSFPPPAQAVKGPANLRFEQGISLATSSLGEPTVPAGQPAEVRLDWQGLDPAGGHRVTVRLLDADGHAVAHTDRLLREGAFRDEATGTTAINLAVAVPHGTPPGAYQLVAGLRRPDGSDVALVDEQGTKGTVITLLSVEVVRPARPPSLDQLALAQRLNVEIGSGVRLAGYSLPATRWQAGQPLQAVLFWQSTAAGDRALEVTGQLVDAAGRVVGEQRGTSALRRYPPAGWQNGEIVRDYLDLPTGRVSGDGEYQVRVRASTGGDAPWLSLGTVQITGRARSFELPAVQQPLDARFGEFAGLVGLSLQTPAGAGSPRAAPGDALAATLVWQAAATTDRNYTVFVQLLDPAGKLVAQHDGMPDGNAAPTSTWVEQEVIADRHQLAVPKNAAPGRYRLIAGLYDAASNGERARLQTGVDFVELAVIEVQ